MNKLTTAVFGLTLLAGSVFAAVPQTTDKMADTTKAAPTATKKKASKKVKAPKKTTTPAATPATKM